MKDITWKQRALCRDVDPAVFFPPSEEDQAEAVWHAKAVCVRCPVLEECFDTYQAEAYGVFGGTSGPDRKRIRNRRITPRDVWAKTRRRFGIPEPKREYDRDLIRALAEEGLTNPEIALRVGAPRSTVWSILNRQRAA